MNWDYDKLPKRYNILLIKGISQIMKLREKKKPTTEIYGLSEKTTLKVPNVFWIEQT